MLTDCRFSDTLLARDFEMVEKLVSLLLLTAKHKLLTAYAVVRAEGNRSVKCHLTLYSDAGGRNFLFLNVPAIERSPLVRVLPPTIQSLSNLYH